MRQPYTLTSSLEVGVPHVKNCLKGKQMAHTKKTGKFIANTQVFLIPLGPWNTKKNQGFVCQNFVHTKHAWIQEYLPRTLACSR